jgi:hypothetical protein
MSRGRSRECGARRRRALMLPILGDRQPVRRPAVAGPPGGRADDSRIHLWREADGTIRPCGVGRWGRTTVTASAARHGGPAWARAGGQRRASKPGRSGPRRGDGEGARGDQAFGRGGKRDGAAGGRKAGQSQPVEERPEGCPAGYARRWSGGVPSAGGAGRRRRRPGGAARPPGPRCRDKASRSTTN